MKKFCNSPTILIALFGYAESHGPPFKMTDSSAKCATECIDEGFVFCKTDNSKIGTCCNAEEGANRGECSSANLDSSAKYLFCPYEDECESKVFITGNEEQTF